jgi:hypothetical protein
MFINELERLWENMAIDYFKILSQYLPEFAWKE